MKIQKLLRYWPFERGRDRFFHSLPESTLANIDSTQNPTILKNGLKIFTLPGDYLSRWLKCYGECELQTSKQIKKYAKSDEVFLDIGANLGFFSTEVACLKAGRVISFEPNPTIAKLLRKTIDINELQKSITLVEAAISNKEETATFVEHPTNKGSSSLEANSDDSQLGNRYEVKVISLDENEDFATILESTGMNIGLVKMDIEGSEEYALRGMKRLLEKHQPKLIVELLDSQLKLFGSSKDLLITYLRSIGYDLHMEFDGNGLFIPNKGR